LALEILRRFWADFYNIFSGTVFGTIVGRIMAVGSKDGNVVPVPVVIPYITVERSDD